MEDKMEDKLKLENLSHQFPKEVVAKALDIVREKKLSKPGQAGFLAAASLLNGSSLCIALAGPRGACILRPQGRKRKSLKGSAGVQRVKKKSLQSEDLKASKVARNVSTENRLDGSATTIKLPLAPSTPTAIAWGDFGVTSIEKVIGIKANKKFSSLGLELKGSLVAGVKKGSEAERYGISKGWNITNVGSFQVGDNSKGIKQAFNSMVGLFQSSIKVSFEIKQPKSSTLLVGLSNGAIKLFDVDGRAFRSLPCRRIHSCSVEQIEIKYRLGRVVAYILFQDGAIAIIKQKQFVREIRAHQSRLCEGVRVNDDPWSLKSVVYIREGGGKVGGLCISGSTLPGFHRLLDENTTRIKEASFQLVMTGDKPFLESYSVGTNDEVETPRQRQSTRAMVKDFMGGVFNTFFESDERKKRHRRSSSSLSQNAKEPSKQSMTTLTSLTKVEFDSIRAGLSVVSDPTGTLIAVSDHVARITIWDATTMVAMRWFKGYRDAKCAWIASKGKVMELYLAIYVPVRGLLELWPIVGSESTTRAGARSVGINAQLCQTKSFTSLHKELCILIRADGRLSIVGIHEEST